MTYSAWICDDEDGREFTFVPGESMPEQLRERTPMPSLLKVFEAANWNDAMRQYHEWQGWEPYKPMLDANGIEYPDDGSPIVE